MLRRVWLFFLFLFLLPLVSHAAFWATQAQAPNWHSADWSSSGLLPPASSQRRAVVYLMAARTGRWKGIFAHHSWLVIKRRGARSYTRYDVVGWGAPVRKNNYAADGRWYSHEPRIIASLSGAAARRAIPKIWLAISRYPFAAYGDYHVWPGPNSNTFVAFIARAVPELAAGLLPTAVGKDYSESLVGKVPSGTGWQISWRGILGISLAWVEGFEINLFGAVAGLDLRRPALKLPGWGRIGMAAG